MKISRHGSLGQREPRSRTVVATPACAKRKAVAEAPKPDPTTIAGEWSAGSGSGAKISGTHSRNNASQIGSASAVTAPAVDPRTPSNVAAPTASRKARLSTSATSKFTRAAGGRLPAIANVEQPLFTRPHT
uniref:hypothetical protein n=1 Tax=Nocardia cyriacigeorgica TaxID=135487 RepID=UPI001E4740CF